MNYLFFLPTGYTQEILNSAAIAQVSNQVSFLPTACQANIKKLICSQAYQPCYPGADLTNPATWNPTIYGLGAPLPIQRPCLSVCTAVQTSCLGIPDVLGIAPDCAAQKRFLGNSNPLVDAYDSNNNNATCADMSSAKFQVAGSIEPYAHANDDKGACSGIVTQLFVPPGPVANSALAPMQAPGVVQTLIEGQLRNALGALPVFLGAQCRFALREYFCSAYMRAPYLVKMDEVIKQSVPSALYSTVVGALPATVSSYSTYLYSPPDKSLCLNYATTCGTLIYMAGNPLLTPNCSSGSYATGNSTILSLSLPFGGSSLTLNINAPSNTLPTARQIASDAPRCPVNFVIPDTPNDPDITWIPLQGCAVGCRTPIWSNAQWTQLDQLVIAIPWIALFLTLVFLAVWCGNTEKRTTDYAVIFFAVAAGILSTFFCIMRSNTFSTQFCRNNAVPYGNTDGFNYCSVSSIFLWYFGLAAQFAAVCVAIDQFTKLVQGVMPPPPSMWYGYFIAVFILPFFFIIYPLKNTNWAYQSATHLCLANNDDDFNYFWYPFMALTIVDVLIIVPTFIIAFTKGLKFDGGPFMFLLFYFACQISLILARYSIQASSNDKKANDHRKVWIACVFGSWDGVSDSSYSGKCGATLPDPPDYNLLMWVYVCANGLPLFLVLAYLINPEFYRAALGGGSSYKVAPAN